MENTGQNGAEALPITMKTWLELPHSERELEVHTPITVTKI